MARIKVFRKDRPGESEEVVVHAGKTRHNKSALGFPSGKVTKGGTRIPPAVINESSPSQTN